MAFPEPPDGRAIVQDVFNKGGHELQTKGGCGRFTEACLRALEARWPGQWNHLKKSGGQNQWNGHSVDGGVHAPTGYFVDMIGSSETPSAKPSWHLDKVEKTGGGPRYKGRTDLFLPVTGNDEPEPIGDTHRYVGGGNDTGTCDQCGQPRDAAVHRGPESKKPHAYDGGEQDTGVCDICGQPRSGPLHGSAQPDPEPEPNDEPEPQPDEALPSAIVAAIQAAAAQAHADTEALRIEFVAAADKIAEAVKNVKIKF